MNFNLLNILFLMLNILILSKLRLGIYSECKIFIMVEHHIISRVCELPLEWPSEDFYFTLKGLMKIFKRISQNSKAAQFKFSFDLVDLFMKPYFRNMWYIETFTSTSLLLFVFTNYIEYLALATWLLWYFYNKYWTFSSMQTQYPKLASFPR